MFGGALLIAWFGAGPVSLDERRTQGVPSRGATQPV